MRRKVCFSDNFGHDDAHCLCCQEKGSGVAEITFLLRAFTPEEELADSVSAALGDISWEKSEDKRITREW